MNGRPRAGRGAIVGIGAAVIVVIAIGIGAAIWLGSRGDSAAAGAQRYLEALSSGDGEAVRAAFADDSAPDRATLDAFAAADAYLQNPRVADTKASGDGSSAVSVTFDIAGEARTASVSMRERDGRWLAGPDALGTLRATTTIGDAVRIGTLVVETSEAQSVLPAVYEVLAAPEGVLTGSATAVVTPGAATEVTIEAILAPDAAERAQPAVDEYLEACTGSSTAAPLPMQPAACGISIPWGADLASAQGFAFRVERLPQIALDGTGGFMASGGVYVVTVSGRTRDGSSAEFTYRDEAWTLRGALDFQGGELVLRAW